MQNAIALAQCAARSKWREALDRRGRLSASVAAERALARSRRCASATSDDQEQRRRRYGMIQLLRTCRQASPAVVHARAGVLRRSGWIRTPRFGAWQRCRPAAGALPDSRTPRQNGALLPGWLLRALGVGLARHAARAGASTSRLTLGRHVGRCSGPGCVCAGAGRDRRGCAGVPARIGAAGAAAPSDCGDAGDGAAA